MMLTRRTIFILPLFVILSACHYPVRILSDSQIDKHYKDKAARPELKYMDYKNLHIHYAVLGDSTKPLLLIIHGAPGAWWTFAVSGVAGSCTVRVRLESKGRVNVGCGRRDGGVTLQPGATVPVWTTTRTWNRGSPACTSPGRSTARSPSS